MELIKHILRSIKKSKVNIVLNEYIFLQHPSMNTQAFEKIYQYPKRIIFVCITQLIFGNLCMKYNAHVCSFS